ncbi:hypothetical protein P7K49_021146 [Saguinus oedipus]|uniref:Uncharacterized protein n=1 Tax=Saguinus oedipus TaxID=9490 RepID=A0ABQ9URU4_SAGOE|nr:hypothetical protein P7K49_021145 [Saguinus oedipus]KAK2099798.1 hypothetical protein P7K49_021146 [Saguinus oedipus]
MSLLDLFFPPSGFPILHPWVNKALVLFPRDVTSHQSCCHYGKQNLVPGEGDRAMYTSSPAMLITPRSRPRAHTSHWQPLQETPEPMCAGGVDPLLISVASWLLFSVTTTSLPQPSLAYRKETGLDERA